MVASSSLYPSAIASRRDADATRRVPTYNASYQLLPRQVIGGGTRSVRRKNALCGAEKCVVWGREMRCVEQKNALCGTEERVVWDGGTHSDTEKRIVRKEAISTIMPYLF